MTSRIAFWAAVLPAAVLIEVLFVGGLIRGPTLDASVFMQVSETIRAGGMPYRDVWDHKPPGLYVAQAAFGNLVGGDAWHRAWALSVGATLATVMVLRGMLVPLASPIGIGLALVGAVPLLAGFAFSLGGGLTESLAVLPATAGFWMVARRPADPGATGGAGLLLGTAVLVSLQTLPAAAAAVTLLLLHSGRRVSIGTFVVVGLGPLAVTVLWLAVNGALPAAIDQVVVFNRAYVASHGIDVFVVRGWVETLVFALPLVTASFIRLRMVRAVPFATLEFGALMWVILWVVAVVAQQAYQTHYAILVVPALAILAARPLGAMVDTLRHGLSGVVHLAVIAISFVPTAVLTAALEPPARPDLELREIARMAAQLSTPEDELFVWGNEPAVYRVAERDASSRYVYLYPLMTEGYVTPDLIAAEAARWRADPPAVVVDVSYHPRGVGAFPLLGPWRYAGEPDARVLDPLRQIVRDSYDVAATVGDWTVYTFAEP